jgi:hypothetical protein
MLSTCPCRHTAPPARDILPECDIVEFHPKHTRAEQTGNHIGLIVADLEDYPTVWKDIRNPRGKTAKKA